MLIQSLLFSIMRLHLINQRVVIFTSRVFQNTRKNTHACIGVLLSWSFQTWRECYRMICPKNQWRELLQFFFLHSKVVVILAKAIWFTDSSTLTACQEPGRLSKKNFPCFKEREGVKNTLKSDQQWPRYESLGLCSFESRKVISREWIFFYSKRIYLSHKK